MLISRQVRIILAVLALALGSCVTRQPAVPVAPPSAIGAPAYPSDLQGARLYQIAADRSSLHVLVYRGGTLANLGHNHVMSSPAINGYIWLNNAVERSGFDVVVPVAKLIVDDNDARAAEGADFPLNVSDEARTGTQRNMLSAALLDGEHYPVVRLKSTSIAGTLPVVQVRLQLTLKDQTRSFTLPVAVAATAQQLQARGEFELKQTDFGIKPFSVAMGALQVQDTVRIKFDLVANAR